MPRGNLIPLRGLLNLEEEEEGCGGAGGEDALRRPNSITVAQTLGTKRSKCSSLLCKTVKQARIASVQ